MKESSNPLSKNYPFTGVWSKRWRNRCSRLVYLYSGQVKNGGAIFGVEGPILAHFCRVVGDAGATAGGDREE